ncbi:hypothetical protein [Lactiplantibacillus plantarum]|uniref:hypothetical protein n=1 Tax=Lactiplantibacillus plantarum TaxID=1590 RepID=UPI00217DF6C2|nr:hypothetical protein [Lactiplantibacillus plantarum]MCG0662326.1 hypothetical protein [Lactiplantibacillus plantarum]UWF32594.1 hypothetical protein NYR27_06450 [Lactiplantibacillus plantarum]UWF37966.1 hypothetical protein NYR28_09065 [Lactiplantibacillus plantarum]UWF40964.1 hypothetical protein NYR31_09070 [Lactiplantibacillus plantarum]WPB50991.1 hypothetical protein R5R70_08445 [Lactiplantibacillus plantarum]
MEYYSQSLKFASYPDRKDYWGVNYDEMRLILDELCQFIMSDGLSASFTKQQLRVISPYHCSMGANQGIVAIAISTDMALKGSTILSTFADDQDGTDDQLKLSLNEMTKNQIGYTNNIITSFPKSFFLNPYLRMILDKAGDSLSFVEAFNRLLKESKEESKKIQKTLNDLVVQGAFVTKIKEATKQLNRISERQVGISEIIDTIRQAAAEFIKSIEREEHRMKFNPIFKARDLVIDEKLVFGILQFDDTRKEMFDNFIRPKLEDEFGLTVIRSGNIFDSNIDIPENIWTYLNKARIVICDLSGKNPNVFYELGIANTIGKDVIPICDEDSFIKDYQSKLPADIVTRNILFYKNTAVGSEKFIRDLKRTVKATLTGQSVLATD